MVPITNHLRWFLLAFGLFFTEVNENDENRYVLGWKIEIDGRLSDDPKLINCAGDLYSCVPMFV